MSTTLFAFALALFLSFFLTPLARILGTRLGALDHPGGRKLHTRPIPRVGGAAVFVAFGCTIAALALFINTDTAHLLMLDSRSLALLAGATICFVTGLVDDFRGLPPLLKMLLQILAATLVYFGGISIGRLVFGDWVLNLGPLNYPLTVLWFLVFINAINLIDGLDGLAGGVTLFAALLMVFITSMENNYLAALLFAALAGAILGFLRYNFHPASIFLGDGGSYFLGFAFAGFALYGNLKSQVGSALLIPMVALGLPLFDTVLSSIRRFIEGKRVFGADKDHIHHRMLHLGLNTRRTVLLMYGVSIGLCLFSLLLVHMQDKKSAVILMLLAVGAVVFTRKLGYFDYVGHRRMMAWLGDIGEETGISRERRSFLSLQINISRSHSLEQLWTAMGQAFAMLELDQCLLYLSSGWSTGFAGQSAAAFSSPYANGSSRRATPLEMTSICLRDDPPEFKWQRGYMPPDTNVHGRYLYRMELPLVDDRHRSYGTLVLIKDSQHGVISHYSLKRVEHLRRTVVRAMAAMARSAVVVRSNKTVPERCGITIPQAKPEPALGLPDPAALH